jgi:hypothetical protein
MTNLSGVIRVTQDGIAGDEINLKTDLNMDNKNVPDIRLTWYTGSTSRLRFAYTKLSSEGDAVINRSFTFNGKTYTSGTRVLSSLDVQTPSISWIWQFLHFGPVKLGTVLQAKGFWIKESLNAPSAMPGLAISESKSVVAGLPTVGAALDVSPIDMIDAFGEISGITAGKYGHLYDAEGGVKIIPIKYLSVIGGYRILNVQVDTNKDFGKITFKGPFAGASFRF